MDCSVLCCAVPGELVIDILSRLSVKSLMKFRVVCKSWNCLTTDPGFISAHSKVSTAEAEENIILLVHNPCGAKPSLSLHYNATPRGTSPVTLHMKGDGHGLSIIGQCDGIICIRGYQRSKETTDRTRVTDLALFNPATREVKVVPMSRPHEGPLKFGFGYDPMTDDYKVVTVAENNDVAVYSLKTNSWKYAETDTRELHRYNSPQVYLNGFCYWKGNGSSRPEDQKLVSFDLTNEEFCDIGLPPHTPNLYWWRNNNVVAVAINGYLCLIWPTLGPPNVFCLWALVNRSWMKGKVITMPGDYYAFDRWRSATAKYEVVTVRRNGDIILRNNYDGLLKSYNKSTGKVTPMQFEVTLEASNIVYCKETLFSLK